MTYDVFISHSSQSAKTAMSLVANLEADGLKCWVAPRDLNPGHEWAEGIIDGIEASKVFLLLLCPNANQSPHVLREVERAANKKKVIIPILTSQFPISKALEFFIACHHYFDMSGKSMGTVGEELSQAIHKTLGKIAPPIVKPPKKRWFLPIVIFIVLSLIVVFTTVKSCKPPIPPSSWIGINKMVSNADYSIPIVTNKQIYVEGDLLEISCVIPISGYLTIFSHTLGTEKVTMLFPNPGHPENYVFAEETIKIPGTGDNYKLRADADTGKTVLVAFVDQNSSAIQSLQLVTTNQAFVSGSVELISKVRGFDVEVDGKPGKIGAGELALQKR